MSETNINGGAEANKHNPISGAVAVTRIILKLGVMDREHREFWRFFGHAVAEHREAFAVSMRSAAMGYHLRKLAEAYR